MKIVSFNINGLRARPHQLAALIEKHQPDVIGLQETKVADEQFPQADRQQLRQLVRNAGEEKRLGKPPHAYRELFRQLRLLHEDADGH